MKPFSATGIAGLVFVLSFSSHPAFAENQQVSYWQGGYAGFSLGAERSEADPTAEVKSQGYFTGDDFALVNPRASDDIEDNHAQGQLFWGYNHQSGNLVYGLEADLSFSDFKEKNAAGPVEYNTAPGDTFNVTTRVESDWAVNLKARLGYAHKKSLFYIAAGPSLRKFEYDFLFTDTFQPQRVNEDQDKWKLGWTASAGIEHRLMADWTVRLEYRYSAYNNVFDSDSTTLDYPNDGFEHELDLRSNSITLGISRPL
ncbi:outer membrane beta-barrel protein [Methylophaga sp.]|uniref:outer membrane protein n=1 Tax=Methylophaga sp. TaxID=2024840 RepID=UPI0013FE9519|nr:outer membrane beta-barrel protein [Methylophaga sp.]MTI63386.1 porin family protein [Methylophaga sp.]